MDDATPRDAGAGDTSFHARRAVRGDLASLEWIVGRLTPLLLVQAQRRLGPALRRRWDPADLVAETWATALPLLGRLDLDHERSAASLIKYVGTILLGHVQNLARREFRRGRRAAVGREGDAPDPIADLPDLTAGVVTRAVRAEGRSAVRRCLQDLSEAERDVIIFRGIEQRPYKEVAVLMGLDAGTAAVRYHRALNKLRAMLPRSVFDDLEDAGGPET